MPKLINYPAEQYREMGKVWDIESSPNGLIYMASDHGLLETDGQSWSIFKGSKGITRSILVLNDSTIYTGSDMDFGLWTRTALDSFEYRSLYPFKEEVQDAIEEFWKVFLIGDMIGFVSSQNLYLYSEGQIAKIKTPSSLLSSFLYKDTLYIADEEYGLYTFDKIAFKERFAFRDDPKLNIIGKYRSQSIPLYITRSSGLYSIQGGRLVPIDDELSRVLRDAKVFSFELIGESHIAFGTILKGLIIADKDGRIVQNISKNKGLPNNTVLALHYTASEKIWMGLDYGISSLSLLDNMMYFYDFGGDFGTAYTGCKIGDDFYLGTNQGLYIIGWDELGGGSEKTRFRLIQGSEGQVWSLYPHGDQVLLGHDRGLLRYSKGALTSIDDNDGVWTIIPYRDFLITGTYNGISSYKNVGDSWGFYKKLDSISGSCNQLLIHNDSILWVNIPNFGFVRVVLDSLCNVISRKNFLIAQFDGSYPQLFSDGDTVQIISSEGIYIYDSGIEDFIRSGKENKHKKPDNLLQGIYTPLPISKEYAFYPIHNGFALEYLAEKHDLSALNPKPVFRQVEAFSNSQSESIQPGFEVPFKLNNIRIRYILPDYEDVLYQFRIIGQQDQWSQWGEETTQRFVGLSKGAYQFQVRSKVGEYVSEPVSFDFVITKPWYDTRQAYLAYLIILALGIGLVIMLQKRKFRIERARILVEKEKSIEELKAEHRAALARKEQERIQKEYELLKGKLKEKTIELANKAKENQDKSRVLMTIQEHFNQIQENPKYVKPRLNQIRNLLKDYIEVDDHTFEIQMDELHQEFFKKIKEEYPNLSTSDLRLCAYIRIGLNSNEIANILNIQPSSSYIKRSRLRKKLNMGADDDLYDFLNKF